MSKPRFSLLLLSLLTASTLLTSHAFAQEKGPVATVNGQAISRAMFEAFTAEQRAQGAPDNAEVRSAIKEELIRRELLIQEAKKRGLDKKPELQGQMELARQAILVRAFLADYIRGNQPSDDRLKSLYETIKNNLGGTEYKARHILVGTEEAARDVLAKLAKGEKFEELAKQSSDPGSKDKGGDLGWNVPSSYVKPFGDALLSLKKGEITQTPVRTDFGYHIVQLEDSRPLAAPSFEQVKPQLLQQANQQTLEKLIAELRQKAKIQ